MFVANILHNIPREATKGSAGLAESNGAHGAQCVCLAPHGASLWGCGREGPRVTGLRVVGLWG